MPLNVQIFRCPECQAALGAEAYAPEPVCSFCGSAVLVAGERTSVRRFQGALAELKALARGDDRPFVRVGDERWVLGPLVGRGEVADVYAGARLRPPTEHALVKVLRDPADAPLLDAEWRVLGALRRSRADGLDRLAARIPAPIAHGTVHEGEHAGARATVFQRPRRVRFTLEHARASFPDGIDARVAVWAWRRALETLELLHRAGYAHGAVHPPHMMFEDGEHGLRLVGFGHSGEEGAPARAVHAGYVPATEARAELRGAFDLVDCARAFAYALGAPPEGPLPQSVPEPLARLIDAARRGEAGGAMDIHQALGDLASDLFGPPSFHPFVPRSGA